MPLYVAACLECEEEWEFVSPVSERNEQRCVCGGSTRLVPQPFATDVCGSEQSSDVLGISWRSTREREQKMKAIGYDPAGDRVGGARNESHLR